MVRQRGVALLGAFGVLLAGLFSSVAVAAPKERMTTPTSKEAWYAQAPPCSALDCSIVPLVTPYPEDTLHVALTGGQETARTYLSFPLPLPSGGELVDGELKLPIDTDPANGSVTPEEAEMVACLTTSKFKSVRGSLDKPPRTNCRLRKAAIYDEKEIGFTVDLRRFVTKWKKGHAALALVPSKGAQESQQTWHVVFPAAPKTDEEQQTDDAPEIIATLTYTILGQGDPTFGGDPAPPPEAGDASTSFDSGTPPSFNSATDLGASQPVSDLAEAAPPTEVTPQGTTPVNTFIEGFAGPGFAYPIVWALPLLLLLGFGAVGRALTKELYRRDV